MPVCDAASKSRGPRSERRRAMWEWSAIRGAGEGRREQAGVEEPEGREAPERRDAGPALRRKKEARPLEVSGVNTAM